jgi:1,4-dihydroxy-2-naphthoate polyprenyltransferase
MLGLTVALSVPLIQARGWPIIAIGIPSLYFCWGYTGGPVPLAYRGLGELFVILFFGFVAVLGSAFVQSGLWLGQGVLAGFQIGCLSTVLIAVNNLRDAKEDRSTGKRTLAARFGESFARWEITGLILAAFAASGLWLAYSETKLALACLVPLPLGAWIVCQVWRVEGSRLNAVLAQGGALLVIFTGCFLAGLF